MAEIIIKIPHVVWREGRPRFVPGHSVRALGYKGKDLRHVDGRWFDLNETIDWSKHFSEELATRRQQEKLKEAKPKKKVRNHARKGYISFGELLANWHRERTEVSRQVGKPTQRTLKWYADNIEAIRQFDEELWTIPATAITKVMAHGIYKKLREEKGVSYSKALVSTIRPAFGWAEREKGLVSQNPWTDLRMTTPPPRLRVGTIDEMKHLIATADLMEREDIGDAIMLGLCTAQRQNDRLLFKLQSNEGSDLLFKQSKTGAIVLVPAIPSLLSRIEASKQRRAKLRKPYPFLLINEDKGLPWGEDGDTYRKAFRVVCNEASKTLPSLKGFRDQDLRDTAVTWLASAGCTLPQIASVTGHSIENIHKILKHYLARTPDQASEATQKLMAYLDANGGL